MRLYHVPGTRSSRPLWTLEEAGAPYDLVTMSRDERHEPAHLERHPLGKSPAAHDGEGHLFESAALCLQIADQHPAAGLIAAPGTRDRALTYQWLFYAVTEMEPGVVEKYIYGETDAARTAAGTESYRKAAAIIEKELAGKEFIVGGRFSVADIIVAGALGFGAYLGMNDGFTNCAAYLERLHARPAYVRSAAL